MSKPPTANRKVVTTQPMVSARSVMDLLDAKINIFISTYSKVPKYALLGMDYYKHLPPVPQGTVPTIRNVMILSTNDHPVIFEVF